MEAFEGVFLPGRCLRQHLYQRGSHESLDHDEDNDDEDDDEDDDDNNDDDDGDKDK